MEERVFRRTGDYTGTKKCAKVKKHPDLNIVSKGGLSFEKAVADKDLLKEYIKGNVKADEVLDLLEGGILNVTDVEETQKAIIKKNAKDLVRYIRGENALKRDIRIAPVLEFPVGEEYFKESVDAIVVDNDEIEAIVYKAGKPSINERTGIKENNLDNMEKWFRLYTGLQYAKQYFKELVENGDITDKDKTYTISSAYYFMRKSSDDSKIKPRDYDFFSGDGGNVVTLSEVYSYNSLMKKDTNTEYDDKFLKFMEMSDAGVECNEDTCKYCERRCVCQYVKSSEKIEKDKATVQKEINLTKDQQEVIDSVISGKQPAVRVNAGAGSGKTTVLAELYPALIKKGVSPDKILVISFTETGVEEILQRCAARCRFYKLPINRGDIFAKTFNAFGFDVVKEHYELVDLPGVPKLLTDDFKMQFIENLVNANTIPAVDMSKLIYDGYQSTPWIVELVAKVFDIIANKHLSVDDNKTEDIIDAALRETRNFYDVSITTIKFIMSLYKTFEEQYKEDGFLTYSDQEPLMLEVFEKAPKLLEELGFEYIIVDEFQDSNAIQMDTLKLLTSTSSFKKIVVVGDDDQSIFAFRETGPEFMINFPTLIGLDTKTINLVDNRRSTGEILELANACIRMNKDRIGKDLVSVREKGTTPSVNGFHSRDAEYDFITDEILKHHENGKSWESMAVIMATKAELVAMSAKLVAKGIPYVMKNPMNLLENSRVQAALALSDAFYQPDATLSFFTYLVAKYDGQIFDKRTDEEINYEIEEMLNIFSGISLLSIEQQQGIFHDYLNALRGQEEDELYEYFLQLLYQNEDFQSELTYTRIFRKYGAKMAKKLAQDYVGVTLTTAHSSKGMEWDIVFNSVTKYDSVIFHRNVRKRTPEIEEKRRLLFVSMTRARDELYMTGQYEIGKTEDGDPIYNNFLRDIFTLLDADYDPVDHEKEEREAKRKEEAKEKAKEKRRKQAILIKGSAVREMTEEEKEEYDRLVKHSSQATLNNMLN